jgi:hypothetical protein
VSLDDVLKKDSTTTRIKIKAKKIEMIRLALNSPKIDLNF